MPRWISTLDADTFSDITEQILKSAREVEDSLERKLEKISIGSGFGIPYRDEEKPLNLQKLFKNINLVFKGYYGDDNKNWPTLCIEPGRILVADTGFILTRVTGTKSSYKQFIGLDAGMETLMRPALYGAFHRVQKIGENDGETLKYDITGRICENTDRISKDHNMPTINEEELCAIMDSGAYGYSMSHNFNTRPRPAEVLIDEEKLVLIREENQSKTYLEDAMYKKILILYFLMIQSLLSQHYQSIHQQQLEYYNANYVMLERTDTNIVINPISNRTRNPSREVFGYHPYWMGTAWTSYNFNLISTLAYFSAEVTSTGGLSNLHGWPVASLINEAHEHGTKVVLCATLFNSSDIITLLSSAQYRQNLIDNLLSQVQAGNADGVNIDFESFPASQRSNMVTFITDLTEAFHTAIPGSQVTLAMPPVDWSNAWDYNALASISDGLFIMGYNYHYSGSSTTGPNSTLRTRLHVNLDSFRLFK